MILGCFFNIPESEKAHLTLNINFVHRLNLTALL